MKNNILSNGIISLNKPVGITSTKAISKIKRILTPRKIGHGGTLDPLASGVLLIFINRATKFSKYALECSKEYLCTIRFGQSTNTFDDEGEVIEEKPIPELNSIDIQLILSKYVGDFQQTPPIHSAVKINGKPSYYYARKNIDVNLKPRKVSIYDISFIAWDGKNLKLKISTSKGFYVRSFADEIGRKFNTVSFLKNLKRTRVGMFQCNKSICLDELTSMSLDQIKTKDIIQSPDQLLIDHEPIIINDNLVPYFTEKQPFEIENLENHTRFRVYDKDKCFLGTAHFDNSNKTLIRNELYKTNNIL